MAQVEDSASGTRRADSPVTATERVMQGIDWMHRRQLLMFLVAVFVVAVFTKGGW